MKGLEKMVDDLFDFVENILANIFGTLFKDEE
jgi:hypothetical protein